jgi:DNA-binding transcriptional LysR family regulator
MGISKITSSYDLSLELRQLRVLDVILQERNLTRAAGTLGLTQPALSKTLKQLRRYFSDPLLVRVGNRMQPTPLALRLGPEVREILDRVTVLNAAHRPFDAATSAREFSFCVVDSGLIRLVPTLLDHLERHAPHVRLNVRNVNLNYLESWLESGQLDFAMGSYPSLTKHVRRQTLWSIRYVSLVRQAHPSAGERMSAKVLASERHVLVSTAGTGHSHQQIEKSLERVVPSRNIVCRVPSFLAAAVVASRADVVVTIPSSLADSVASSLGLVVLQPGFKLPRIDVSQYWHERFHREPGSRWIRDVFSELFYVDQHRQ